MNRIHRLAVAKLNAVKIIGGRDRDALGIGYHRLQLAERGVFDNGHKLCITLRGIRLGFGNAPLFDEFIKAELLENSVQLRTVILVPNSVLGLKLNGCRRADRRKLKGKASTLLALAQLFANALFNVKRIELAVNAVKIGVFLYEAHRRFFADSGYAGDIIRRIAHERLQVNYVLRRKAVLLRKQLGSIFGRARLTHAAFDVAYVSALRNELEAVLITGYDAAVPAVTLALFCHRTEQVVRLIALKLKTQYAHRVENAL